MDNFYRLNCNNNYVYQKNLFRCFILLYTSEIFSIMENKLIGYADDYTLIAVVSSPGVRVTVPESLSRHLVKVIEWCDLWGMKLNASKAKTMIVSRSPEGVWRNRAEGV